MKRNEQLTLPGESFEKFYDQYGEVEIGALDNTGIGSFHLGKQQSLIGSFERLL